MKYKDLRYLVIISIIVNVFLWWIIGGFINEIEIEVYIYTSDFSYYSWYPMIMLKIVLWLISSIIFSIFIIASVWYLRVRKKRLTKIEKMEKKGNIPIKQNRDIQRGIYCQICGIEILDLRGEFCSGCGTKIIN